jgi:hypothetical protein
VRRMLSASALLLLAGPLFAEVRITGELKVPANHLVRLSAEGAAAGSALVWDVSPEDAADVEEVNGRLLFVGPPGTYKIKLRTLRLKDGATILESARATVVIGGVPPGPDPDPGPDPKPNPAPIPAAGLHVLIVYESAEVGKLPAAQEAILYAQSIRDYLNAKCPVGPDNKTKEWRIWDKDVATAGESKLWQEALKRPRASVPWIIVSNPAKGGGFEGPLPANVADTLTLLKKYGGD